MKLLIKQIIIVEGKYDKIKLENIVDGLIVCTEGFGIFKNRKDQQTILKLARERGAVILTDSDRAGFIIRKRLHDYLQDCYLIDLYIPDAYGKEKRKASFSAEGKLGVEGMDDEVLFRLLAPLESSSCEVKSDIKEIDLYQCGMFGRENSTDLRRNFQNFLGLPARLNKNMLLKILCSMFSKEQFFAIWEEFITKNKGKQS